MTAPEAAAQPSRRAPSWILGRSVDHNLAVLVVLGIAALAWTLIAVTHSGDQSPPQSLGAGQAPKAGPSPSGNLHHGTSFSGHGLASPVLATSIVGVVGWVVMVVAMMLPPALPMLQTVRRLVSGRSNAGQLSFLSVEIFIAAWALVGVVLVAGDLGVRALWSRQGWAATHPHLVVGVVLVVAGLYQLSPLKDLCLRGCRSPRSFALAHWRGQRSAEAETVAMTWAYARSCVGCCWALMLVCFAVGAVALPVMVALAVLMAAERLVAWGRRLVRPAGLCLIVLGMVLILQLLPTELIL